MPDSRALLHQSSGRETRARRKLRLAVEQHPGWSIDPDGGIEWAPLAPGSEMCGMDGGWTVWCKHADGRTDHVLGLNVDEVLAALDQWGLGS